MRWERDIGTEGDTRGVARELAGVLAGGDVIALHGDLGAGKTTFVRYLVEALGGVRDDVTSPTFSLIDEHPIDAGLFVHADLYRIETADEIEPTGLLDYLGELDCIAAIEWPDVSPQVIALANYRVELGQKDGRRWLTATSR